MPKLKPFEVPKPDIITKKLPTIENINSSLNRINIAKPVDRFRGFRTNQPERKSQQDSPEQSPIKQTSITSEVPNNVNQHKLTTAKTIARAEGKDSPGNPATDKENDAPTEKATTPTNEQTPKPATKEPQKDTVPVTAENKQATQSTEQQTEQTKQTAEIPQQEFSESRLSEAESVGPGDNQERLEKVVESLKSQVKELENALQKGSEVRENIRKGIFGPKVLFMLRLINILANNSVITKLLKLDSKVADIKDLWRDYQEAKNNSRNRKRNPDPIQFAATFNGEAQDKGSEAKEANFENANKEFIKEKSQGFLNEIASELQEEGMDTESIQKKMFDEINSLVDAGREVDLRRLTQYKPQILDKIKTQVQNFAKGKITKNVLGLNIMIAIRS